MALFSSKKQKETKVEKKESAPAAAPSTVGTMTRSFAHILKHARITEKASMQQGMNVYTFNVAPSASKRDIMLAVRALYKVTPRKVAVVNIRGKERRNMRSGTRGMTTGGKKAYVFLKKGDEISIS